MFQGPGTRTEPIHIYIYIYLCVCVTMPSPWPSSILKAPSSSPLQRLPLPGKIHNSQLLVLTAKKPVLDGLHEPGPLFLTLDDLILQRFQSFLWLGSGKHQQRYFWKTQQQLLHQNVETVPSCQRPHLHSLLLSSNRSSMDLAYSMEQFSKI